MLKLHVGLSKKIGQPDFGSLGASCHLELELDEAIVREEVEMFQNRVQTVFARCGEAVDDELARRADEAPVAHAPVHNGRNSNGHSDSGSTNNGHRIRQKQQNYIDQLASQIEGLGRTQLGVLCERLFAKGWGELSSFEASALIEQLKAIKRGDVKLADLVEAEASA
jgi:hypothetical protein